MYDQLSAAAQIIDDRQVQDIFVSDLSRVDLLGKNARFTFHVEHIPELGAPPIRLVRAKLIMPIDVVPLGCARVLFTLGHMDARTVREFSCRVH